MTIHDSTTNYAYVSLLYGNNEYFFGALMLGHNLSSVKAIYDRVLLVTADVLPEQKSLLSRFYKIIEVPYIHTPDQNFAEVHTIFRKIFTKLYLFNLTQYKKVLFMDLDMLVLKNMDHLFQMEAPAAKFRKSGMLNEPEQDYLSYRFRSEWRHISREYNFQPLLEDLYDPRHCPIQEIYAIHFSWYINPWELLFENREKVLSLINHLDPKQFVPDTQYFTLWEHQFRILHHNLTSDKINVFKLGTWTNMRSEFIDQFKKN